MEDKNTFIGKHAKIKSASNKSLVDIQGIIVNETKNTFIFDVEGTKKTILKKGVSITINERTITSQSKRMEERIKSR